MATRSSQKEFSLFQWLNKNRNEAIIAVMLVGVYLISYYNYLLFHSLVELFAIIISIGTFMIMWNARRYSDSAFFTFIGVALLFVGIMEAVHTLAYKGMGIFAVSDTTNLPTQLWIATRYLTSLSFLAAFWFLKRKPGWMVILGYCIVCALVLLSIFYWHIFPICYSENSGLTPFKIISEYVIIAIFLASTGLLIVNRKKFDEHVFKLLTASLIVMVAAEIAFTHYINVYGTANLIGHLLIVLAFYLVYKALIEKGLAQPYSLLFRNLKLSQESLEQRTAELTQSNSQLIEEKSERGKIEKELDDYRKHLEQLVDEQTSQLMESYKSLEAEIKVRKTAENELRALSNRIVELQEEERQILSRELHDQTGQSLTVLNLLLTNIKRSLKEGSDRALADIEESQLVVKELLQQVRDISVNLHPSMLDNIGLVPTLEWYTGEFSKRTGIKIHFDCQGSENNLPGKLRITAYRVIQESLTNIARYSGAQEAFIQIQFQDNQLKINIKDTGNGFDIAKVSIKSSGIRGMRERALSMKGSLEITSEPGKGTQIEMVLPI